MNNIHFIFIICSSIFVLTDTAKKYGLFSLSVKSFEMCKGPKIKDCSQTSVNVISDSTISVEVNVTENAGLDKVKVMSFSTENNQSLRMQFNKPCDNLFLKPIFQTLFNASNQCIVPKGIYKVSMNLEDVFHKYYGGMYLYGTHTFKSVFFSKYCNFMCTKSVYVLSPRK